MIFLFILFFFSGPKEINQQELLQLVNNARQKGCNCGGTYMPPVQPVSWSSQLANAAAAHSRDMKSKNYFSHQSRNGKDPGDRIRAAGYNWKAYGENIAFNYADEQAVVEGWLKSVNHCRNIMNANFKDMGVARSGEYWVQDFGAKK